MRSSTTAGYGSTRLAALETLEQRRLLTTYLVDDSWSAGPRPAGHPAGRRGHVPPSHPTEAFEVDLGIDELSAPAPSTRRGLRGRSGHRRARPGTVEFAVTRSGPDGDAMREAAGAGTVTMRDGRVKLQVHPLELVTLRSTAPVD